MADEKKPTDGDPIGYGKPPRRTQFKKGQSGNPTGRPKGTPNFATAMERALGEQVVVNEGGQRRTVNKFEAATIQLANKAAMGDPRAMQQVLKFMDTLDDEPSEPSHLTPTMEADTLVMNQLIERIRTTTKGEQSDDPHT